MTTNLQQIRDLQYHDKAQAEALLLAFLNDNYPLQVTAVELTPLAVSLNSFNGFLTLANGKRRFFKTHTETDTVIEEYYNAEMLAEQGYPVIQPLFKSTEPGKQLLIYERIDDQSVFDVAHHIEKHGDQQQLALLAQAQHTADHDLLTYYRQSMQVQHAADAAQAPIHQLFYHRLTGGRLDRFYAPDQHMVLPQGTVTSATVRQAKWIINGQVYHQTLDDIITYAIQNLNPHRAGLSIVGHGDAHNGNVFLQIMPERPQLLYFDPAFAGRHHPLLDLAKPLFHNVFAMWMYYPHDHEQARHIQLDQHDGIWHVCYDNALSDVRQMFLQSKVQNTLIPILRDLQASEQLPINWRAYLKSALFCCPFLTLNLADHTKFPPSIRLLGLAMSVEMGSESHKRRSLIDQTLDDVQAHL